MTGSALPGTLFVALLLGHLVGDWLVQTDRQAAEKTTSWPAMARHIAGYHVAMTAALASLLVTGHLALRSAILALAISAASHALIDRRWPVVRLLRATGSARFATQQWAILVADQALHLSILAAVAIGLGL